MHPKTKYVFTASMDVQPDKEAVFNEVYDAEHVPLLLKVPGVLAATRVKNEPLTMIIGGARKTSSVEGEPSYSAIYELESAEVLVIEGAMGLFDGVPHTEKIFGVVGLFGCAQLLQ